MSAIEPASLTAPSLADDLLEGADAIGDFLFGRDPDPAAKRARLRRVYRLTTEVPPDEQLPVSRLGASLFARKSTLMQWIADREKQPRPAGAGITKFVR